MILNLFLSLSLLFIAPTTPTELDCDKFKEGTFESYDANREKNVMVAITRQSGKQIEIYEPTNGKIELSVDWTSNCSYEMVYLSTNIEGVKPYLGKKLIVDILEVDGSFYKFTASFEGAKKSDAVIGWMKKLK